MPRTDAAKSKFARARAATSCKGQGWCSTNFFSQISFVDIFNFCVFITFTICYTYQLYYVLVVLSRKPNAACREKEPPIRRRRFLPATKCAVIGDLIHSIKVQNYPTELIERVRHRRQLHRQHRRCGARGGRDCVQALATRNRLAKVMRSITASRSSAASMPTEATRRISVFDADNVLDVNYFREMNKTFDNGAKASTSYRNSKNYDFQLDFCWLCRVVPCARPSF